MPKVINNSKEATTYVVYRQTKNDMTSFDDAREIKNEVINNPYTAGNVKLKQDESVEVRPNLWVAAASDLHSPTPSLTIQPTQMGQSDRMIWK
ncbi:hypothetical protein [Photobacterium atrarenae]|uniref:Uncharacterized protein n=1 Tax=Photobacterium atrarenae TaxID=865757 RepID=A0ABY5GQ82_9GAMM|nr:hypothetical protein [Photobacterium atrarenae]UTV30985.1 hypothetical protein NNL38_24575 [Photobacterium atrarenae]